MKKKLVLAALLLITFSSAACMPRMIGPVAHAALFTAAAVGTAAVVAHHAAHYHHWNCGCPRNYTDGRWNYYYQGSWEYYDNHGGVWYRY